MKILHIGDFHYKSSRNNYEQSKIVKKLLESLISEHNIDFCFFTGDLVHSGKRVKDFTEASTMLLEPLHNILSITKENIILCAGNHDINRDKNSKAIVSYYDNDIKTNDQLNDEFEKRGTDFLLSLKPSADFLNFYKEFASPKDEVNELYSIHKRIVDQKSIAIVTLNTAWLSSGLREDKNFLMFPTLALKDAIVKIKDCQYKILVVHHPISNLKEFNAIELEDIIHKEFNIMFSGHLHKEQISTRYAGTNGIFANTTQATLTFDKDGEIGYTILECNIDEEEILLTRATYSKKEEVFHQLSKVNVKVPCGEHKSQQNKLRGKIISKFKVELDNSNELLLDYAEESNINFLQLFTKPVLTLKSETSSGGTIEAPGRFNYENLYLEDNNFVVYGKDKSGKTSLLKMVQLQYLKNYPSIGKAPFYLDYKELTSKNNPLSIFKLIRTYYEVTNAEAQALLDNNSVVFLIDNIDSQSPVHKVVLKFLEEHKQAKFIICSDNSTSKMYFEDLDHLQYKKIEFEDLSRTEIRLYTEKRHEVKKDEREEVLERITKVCKQLRLPVNYWTVSLILLIYKKSSDDYNKNLYGILDLCVDEILLKKQLVVSKSKLTFEQYKEICGKLAHYLLINYKDQTYSATYVNIIQYIKSLIDENIRIVADAKEILDYLLLTGLLKQKADMITFRLNGLFEYFLAFYIHQHPEFKDEILKDDGVYLSFKNELEIYTGFNRQDEQFLKQVFDKTKKVFDPLINGYKTYGNFDDTLLAKIGEATDFFDQVKKLNVDKVFDNNTKDLILDHTDPMHTQSEVQIKELIETDKQSHENLERHLTILSRVLRNSDNIQNNTLIYEIFDFLIEAYCSFGFFLIDWAATSAKRDIALSKVNDDSDEVLLGTQMINLVTKFIPILTQSMLYDGVGHQSMKKIVNKKIEQYTNSDQKNQYKLFLLYFFLLDLDLKNNKDLIDKVLDSINLSPLKVSNFFKLTFYLGFKTNDNKDIQALLRLKIQKAHKNMDSTSDVKELNQLFSSKAKVRLSRKAK